MKKDYLAINKKTNYILNFFLVIIAITSVMPLIFVVIISFTSEESIKELGYQLFPKDLSLDAYIFLFSSTDQLIRSYANTIIITVAGTLGGLVLTTLYSYALASKDFKFKKIFGLIAFIPMLFSGGIVASYLVMTQVLGLKDNLLALIFPLLINTFYIIVMRTFFQTSVPEALVEAAKIDGANEFQTFLKIVLPISLPGMATIGLFLTLAYWNDWFNAMLYITSDKNLPLQYMLIRIQNSTDFLASRGSQLGTAGSAALASLPTETMKMAVVVLTTLPIAMAYPFFQRYFVSGLTLGAVKE